MPNAATTAAHKTTMKAEKEKVSGRGNIVKWLSFLSTFMLNRMCEIISNVLKEVHMNNVAKQIFDFYGQEVTSTQVYNHLRK